MVLRYFPDNIQWLIQDLPQEGAPTSSGRALTPNVATLKKIVWKNWDPGGGPPKI